MSLWSRIKRWFTGGNSTTSNNRTTTSSRHTTTNSSRNRTTSYYRSGGSGSSGGGYSGGGGSYEDPKETIRRQAREKREATTKSLASISKNTDALSSGKKQNSLSSFAESQQSGLGSGRERAINKLERKATPPTAKSTTKKLESISNKIEKDRESYHKATGHKYDTEHGTKEERARARQRIKSGEYQSDAEAEKWEVKHHPIAASAARGALSGTTFGASELVAQKSKKRKETGAEQYYQENKSKGAEFAGEIAGSLVGFGATGEASNVIGKAVLRGGARKLGGRAGVKALNSGVKGASEYIAKNGLIRKVAEKELEIAVKKGTVKVADEAMRNRLIKELATNRAKRIIGALGEDVSVNLTTGALSDVLHASANYDVGSSEWWNELKKSAEFNAVLGTVSSVAPALRARSGLPFVGGVREDSKKVIEDVARKERRRLGELSEDGAARFLNDTAEVKNPRMPEAKGTKAPEAKPQSLDEAIEKAAVETVERNADDTARSVVNNVDNTRPQTIDEAIERKAVETVERNADDIARETPRTELVPGEETVRAGENARTGERTEFRRGDAEKAKEQARNKRTTNNREAATQESFDRDFEAFERKVSENQAKAEEIKQKIRSATSDEEKAALKKQLDNLNAEVKREYNQASLRYHPDRGGSNEWMGKFNNVYDDFKNNKFKSRGFKSAESSTRANTGARERYRTASAGGNGNTPPPRSGAAGSGEREFRRPRGKARRYTTTDSVEDIVYKRAERPAPREKIEDAGKTVRTQMVDSLAAFEDVERAQAKAAHAHVDHGATDRLRRHQAIANRSVGNKQIKYSGDRYSGKVTRVGADGKAYEIENGTSLKDIFKGMDEQTEREFNSYLLLRHAPDRLREGKPIFDRRYTYSIDGSKNVIDLNDPATCLREAELRLERHPEFARKAEELYQYIQNELQNRVDAGLLSQDTVSDWMHRYPNYVPTGRSGFNELHGVSGKTVGAGDIKGAKGSDLDIRNIRDQLSQATTRNWRDITTNDLFKKTFGDKIATELAKQPDGGVQMVLDNSINVGRAHEGGKYYADIFIDGRKNRVEIEKKFYDGLADLYKNGRIGVALIDTTNDAFSKVASVWKNLITEWSPIFMVKNGMRDFPEAVINSKQTKEFITSMPEAMRDLLNGGPYSTALKDSGISQSTFIDLDKAIRAGKDQKSKLARANERKLNRGILTLFVISVICFLTPPVMVFSLFLYYMIF